MRSSQFTAEDWAAVGVIDWEGHEDEDPGFDSDFGSYDAYEADRALAAYERGLFCD